MIIPKVAVNTTARRRAGHPGARDQTSTDEMMPETVTAAETRKSQQRLALTAGDEDAERILPYALVWLGSMQVATRRGKSFHLAGPKQFHNELLVRKGAPLAARVFPKL